MPGDSHSRPRRTLVSRRCAPRVRVSQPVARGPIWLEAEAHPGALLRWEEECNWGMSATPTGTGRTPEGPIVRLFREVACRDQRHRAATCASILLTRPLVMDKITVWTW